MTTSKTVRQLLGRDRRSTRRPEVVLDSAMSAAHDRQVNVEAINIGPSDAIAPVESAIALAGKGLKGDRHLHKEGAKPGQALTLIEAEVLEDVGLPGTQSRRQVVVRGVRLNDLVGRRFRVGGVECLGVEICEPCLHLQQMTRPGIIKQLLHRGGLNADILNDGRISVGDPVLVDQHQPEAEQPSE
jgi:MOSC domain-containing protein YiiM